MNIKEIFQIVALVMSIIFVITVVLKTRKGMKRGAYLEPCALGLVLLSAITAFIGMTIACGAIFSSFEGKTMQDLVDMLATAGVSFDQEILDVILAFDVSVISYILAIPVAILAPIAFVILYALLKLVFSIIFNIVKAAVKIPKRVDNVGKIIGGALGAVEGVLVMVILFVPLTSVLHMGTTVMAKMDVENETLSDVVGGVEELTSSPILTLVDLAGGEFLSNELSTVNLENSRINISNEIAYAIDLFSDITKFINNSGDSGESGDIGAMLTPENEEILDSILETLGKSDYMPILLSGGMHVVSNVFFSEVPENPTEAQDKLMGALRDLLITSENATVVDDLSTMKELIFFLENKGVIDVLTSNDEEAIKNVLTVTDENGNTVIKSAINILRSNPRTSNIIAALNELSISIMCESMGTDTDSTVVYESVKGGLNDLITIDPELPPEEYKENVKETLNTTLTDNGIVLDEEIVDTMTDYVTEYLDNARESGNLPEEIGDEEVTDIILTYYDAYLNYIQNNNGSGDGNGNGDGTNDPTFPDIPGFNPDDLPDNFPDIDPDDLPDIFPGLNPDDLPDNFPDINPDDLPDNFPDINPDDLPDNIPDINPDDLPDNIPGLNPDGDGAN